MKLFAAVVGRPDDFLLIEMPLSERSQLYLEYMEKHALPYCGVLAFIDGETAARVEPGMEAMSTVLAAVQAFARFVTSRLKEQGNYAAWRERVLAMPPVPHALEN